MNLEVIKQALPALVPMVLETLLKQEEVQDPDEGAWNVVMAGGACLGLLARTVGDDIVPLVMLSIQENITKPEWTKRSSILCIWFYFGPFSRQAGTYC